MKNLEKISWFLPYSKVKDDHPVVANCQVYWRGWVNALSRCGPSKLRLSSEWSKLLFYTLQQRNRENFALISGEHHFMVSLFNVSLMNSLPGPLQFLVAVAYSVFLLFLKEN